VIGLVVLIAGVALLSRSLRGRPPLSRPGRDGQINWREVPVGFTISS
jgi:hypothetical protein